MRWGVLTKVSPRRYTSGTYSTGELGTRKAPVAAAQSPRCGPWGRWRGRGVRADGRMRCSGGRAGCIVRWGGPTVSPRRYTGGTHSTGELGSRKAPVAAANRRGAAPGGAGAAGVCAQTGRGRGRMRCSGGRAGQSHTTRPNHPNEQQTPNRRVTVAQHIYHQNYHLTLLVRIHVDSRNLGTN